MVRIRPSACGVELGMVFGTREVLGLPFSSGDGEWRAVVLCRRCGRVAVAWCNNLRRGRSNRCKSCQISDANRKHGDTPDGMKHPRLHDIWCNMRQRCNSPQNPAYRWYGSKGVSVCSQWDDYAVFRDWAMSSGYRDDLTIDRKDSSGNYEPNNCQWITRVENSAKMQRDKRSKQMA